MLTILAASDKVVPAEHSHRLLANWAGSTAVVTIAATDHSNVMNAEETRTAIRAFLDACPLALAS